MSGDDLLRSGLSPDEERETVRQTLRVAAVYFERVMRLAQQRQQEGPVEPWLASMASIAASGRQWLIAALGELDLAASLKPPAPVAVADERKQ